MNWDEKFICGVRVDSKGTIHHPFVPDDVAIGEYWKTGDGTKYQKRELTNRQWAMML